jgi:hypothetical protein
VSGGWSTTPQHGDSGMAPHPHRVELRGGLGGLELPDQCPACGAPASERLVVRKVFVRRRRRGGGTRYAITELAVPFCQPCRRRHEAAVAESPSTNRLQTYLRSFLIIPVVGALIVAGVMLPAARREAWGAPGAWIAWGVVVLFVGIALASALAMVSETRRYRVRPQTPISAAFDFSDELGTVIEGQRRVYSIQDPGFAERFGAANQDRAWSAEDASRGRRTSAVVGGVLIAALLLWRLLAG